MKGRFSHPQLWLSIDIDSVVVDHLHDGHAQVAPDAEGDAETQAAHDGDDVALGQAAAVALAPCGLAPACRHRPPLRRQLQGLLLHIGAIDLPTQMREGKMKVAVVSIRFAESGWRVPYSGHSCCEVLVSW